MASSLASQSLYQHHSIQQAKRFFVIPHWLFLIPYSLFFLALSSCSATKYIAQTAKQIVLADSNLTSAHVGISIYDPSANKYLYNHDGDKYFIPASNTKLFTCYAAMHYLGDSLVGLEYQNFSDTAIYVLGTGDPSFLSDDFKDHPVLDFLKNEKRPIYIPKWNGDNNLLGFGWTWDDYSSSDAAEKSIFPIHHNLVSVKLDTFSYENRHINLKWKVKPAYFSDKVPGYYSLNITEFRSKENQDTNFLKKQLRNFDIERLVQQNKYQLVRANSIFKSTEVPFYTDSLKTAIEILRSDYGINNIRFGVLGDNGLYPGIPPHLQWHQVYSQPTDSLLKIMMHRSDNFYAEQCLVMIGRRMSSFGSKDYEIISHLINALYKDLPQKPRWVDGSGLSRYNLFSPQDIVTLLNKMKNDFSWDRITTILATGGEGTITSYYHSLKGRIFAKTGTLSNNVALSGFLITRNNKTLIFSVIVNNHMGNTTQIRKTVEKFLTGIAEKY